MEYACFQQLLKHVEKLDYLLSVNQRTDSSTQLKLLSAEYTIIF